MFQVTRSAPIADVVIIGSGAGGGTVTKVLADLGVNVTLLEAGPMLHPEVMVSNRQARETLQAAINELDQPCQFVVTRYALGTLTMKQISTQLGVSESRVSQIYKQARESMSRTLKSRGIYSSGDLLPGRLPRTPAGVLAAGASSDARGAHEDMTVE